MRFPADENCDFAAVRALRTAGHDVLAVSEVALSAPDEQVIELASRDSRLLLTEDKDFGRLFLAAGGRSTGVILIRFPAGARGGPGDDVVQAVQRFGDRLHGRLAVVQPGRVRLQMPLPGTE